MYGYMCLFDGIEDFMMVEGYGMLKVWMSYGDKVVELLLGFVLMVLMLSCLIVGMVDEVCGYYVV